MDYQISQDGLRTDCWKKIFESVADKPPKKLSLYFLRMVVAVRGARVHFCGASRQTPSEKRSEGRKKGPAAA